MNRQLLRLKDTYWYVCVHNYIFCWIGVLNYTFTQVWCEQYLWQFRYFIILNVNGWFESFIPKTFVIFLFCLFFMLTSNPVLQDVWLLLFRLFLAFMFFSLKWIFYWSTEFKEICWQLTGNIIIMSAYISYTFHYKYMLHQSFTLLSFAMSIFCTCIYFEAFIYFLRFFCTQSLLYC